MTCDVSHVRDARTAIAKLTITLHAEPQRLCTTDTAWSRITLVRRDSVFTRAPSQREKGA